MIHCRTFGGFFIMKKNGNSWEYLSKYSCRKGVYKFTWSENQVKYFSDATIENELAWKVFSAVKQCFPDNGVVLYAMIKNKPVRVKYYNPQADSKTINWYYPSDFYAYLPRQIFY